MRMMSEFEIRANDVWTGISGSSYRIENFGYSENPCETMSNILGMFIIWLTAAEEVRQNSLGNNGSYRTNVINQLPDVDDEDWPDYLNNPMGSLRERARSLWGIRIAFTHGNGNIDNVTDSINREYARRAEEFLPGVTLNNQILVLNPGISNHAIRTIVQIQSILN